MPLLSVFRCSSTILYWFLISLVDCTMSVVVITGENHFNSIFNRLLTSSCQPLSHYSVKSKDTRLDDGASHSWAPTPLQRRQRSTTLPWKAPSERDASVSWLGCGSSSSSTYDGWVRQDESRAILSPGCLGGHWVQIGRRFWGKERHLPLFLPANPSEDL